MLPGGCGFLSYLAQLRLTRQLLMNLLSEIVSVSRGKRDEVDLGEVERRVLTPDLTGLEVVCLGVG